jgi:hypothetical protein
MKRGHIILIAGAGLLVAGIVISAVWGVSLASSFMADNTIIQRTSIAPGQSIQTTRNVDSLDRPLSLAIGIDQQQSSRDDGPILRATVTDPNENIVSRSEFQRSIAPTIQPQVTGVYTVTITNLGTEPVMIGGAFGHVPFIRADGQPDIEAMMSGGGLGTIIAGGGLATAGIIVLIVGAIITVIDGRKKQGSTTTTSEGGITYRKD